MEELKTELVLLKESKRDEKKNQIQLEQKHATLNEEVAKEKVTETFLSFSPFFLNEAQNHPKQ